MALAPAKLLARSGRSWGGRRRAGRAALTRSRSPSTAATLGMCPRTRSRDGAATVWFDASRGPTPRSGVRLAKREAKCWTHHARASRGRDARAWRTANPASRRAPTLPLRGHIHSRARRGWLPRNESSQFVTESRAAHVEQRAGSCRRNHPRRAREWVCSRRGRAGARRDAGLAVRHVRASRPRREACTCCVQHLASRFARRTPLRGVGPREASNQTPGAPSPDRVRGHTPSEAAADGDRVLASPRDSRGDARSGFR